MVNEYFESFAVLRSLDVRLSYNKVIEWGEVPPLYLFFFCSIMLSASGQFIVTMSLLNLLETGIQESMRHFLPLA